MGSRTENVELTVLCLIIIKPKLVGIKQFPITNGRYIVLLFKATEFEGLLDKEISHIQRIARHVYFLAEYHDQELRAQESEVSEILLMDYNEAMQNIQYEEARRELREAQ